MKRGKLLLSFFVLVGLAVGLQYENGTLSRFRSVLRECARASTPGSVFAAAPPSCSVLWSANMETRGQDLSQWYWPYGCASGNEGGGVFNSGMASAGPSFDVAHSGNYSAQLRIDTATESGTNEYELSTVAAGLLYSNRAMDPCGGPLRLQRDRQRARHHLARWSPDLRHRRCTDEVSRGRLRVEREQLLERLVHQTSDYLCR